MELKTIWTVIFYIIPPAVAGFAYGWEVGSMGGILAMPQFLTYFHTPSDFRQGLMTAALIAGEFVGSLLVGMLLADRLGRRKTIIGSALMYLAGQVVVVAAQNQGMFIAGRVLNGFGAGPLFQYVSLYTAETTPSKMRGRTTATLNSGIAVGLLIAYWVQYGALNIPSNASWRLCFALQLLPGVAIIVIMLFRAESPRWLVQHDRQEEALQTLADLHARGDTNNVVVRSEFEEIKVAVSLEQSAAVPSYLTLFTSKAYRRRTALAVGLQMSQQASGANIVLYYAAKVFAQTGRTGPKAALLANGISSALLLVSTVHLTIMLDRYGRRKPIFLGPALMGLCLIVVGSMLVTYGSPHFDQTTQSVQFTFQNVAAGNTAIAFMFLFQVFFGGLSSSVPWTYQNEVFPVIARARGTALSVAGNYFANFWLGLYIPQALNSASWKVYFIFAAINLAVAVVGYLFYPETAGKTLEELDLLFTPNRTPFVFTDRDACSKLSMLQHGLDADAEAVATELREKLLRNNAYGKRELDGFVEEDAVKVDMAHQEKV